MGYILRNREVYKKEGSITVNQNLIEQFHIDDSIVFVVCRNSKLNPDKMQVSTKIKTSTFSL